MVWEAVKNLGRELQRSAEDTFNSIEGAAPGLSKLAVLVLIVFLLAWVIILQRKAHVFDMERRAQQVRAQAAERNGLKLAPLGDNSLPDPRYGKDGHFWRNFFLLAGAVVLLGVLAHRYYAKPKGYYYDPGPIYAGPPVPYAPPIQYAPPPQQTLWIEPPRRIEPASQRVVETRPAATVPMAAPVAAILARESSPSCDGKPIATGSARFFVRSGTAAPEGASPEVFWAGFDSTRVSEAREYYERQDRPEMIRLFGPRSEAAAYSANNLAVALFYAGDCAKAEVMFKEAREIALQRKMALADRIRIDQNYAHFRAMKARGG